MILNELEYHLHDSLVVSVQMEKYNRLQLIVKLYPIYYPDGGAIELTFSGIFNFEEVRKFSRQLEQWFSEHKGYGERIDSFNYDKNKVSKTLDAHFILKLDHYEPLEIHCQKLRIVQLDSSLSASWSFNYFA